MDKELLKYTMHEIRCDRGNPYQITNKALADEFYPHIKKGIPSAQMIKFGTIHMVIISQEARNKAKNRLESIINDHEHSIKELQAAIAELDRKEE